jgi:[protein-PII] uridylyltransferase
VSVNTAVSSDTREAYRHRLGEHHAQLHTRLCTNEPIVYLLDSHLRFIDQLVCAAWLKYLPESRISLLATGGYGRGELYPRSDIDLLVIAEPDVQKANEELLGRFFSELWDAGIQSSSAVRSLAQCSQAAREDITVLTALLETRVLQGEASIQKALDAALQPLHAGWEAKAYFVAKREEQRARHIKFNDTYENLEPNLKEGPGGLRDLHMLSWMGQRLFAAKGLRALVALGLLGEDECNTLEREWKVIAKLRFGLHLIGKRAEDRLLFDHQKTLAQWFGLQDEHQHNLAVEQLMQGFFRSASLMTRINDRLLQRFEEQLSGDDAPIAIDDAFELRNGYLRLKQPSSVLENFEMVLRVFETWAEQNALQSRGLHSRTARAIAESLPKILDYTQQPDSARAAFMAMLKKPNAVKILTRMARLGVLARYLPAFGKVFGRMQFDLFHVYTVDQHTLAVLANMQGFASGPDPRFSIAHDIYPHLRRPELLLLSGLFHDIAKGRGGDHSELGAVDARTFCSAHALLAADTELVTWLVEQHLLMSVTAQRNDISDSTIVNTFATKVGDRERLDYLCLLTCADIAGTSPKLWNSWKDRLIADLHTATRYALRRGLENSVNAADRISDARAQVEQGLLEKQIDSQVSKTLLNTYPDDAFLRYRVEQLIWQIQSVIAGLDRDHDHEHTIAIRSHDADRLEIFIRTPDQDGLFAALVATLDRLSLSVLDARILNSKDGYALDNFQLQLNEGARLDVDVFRHALLRAIQSPQNIRPAKRATPRRLKHFKIPVKVEFSAASSLTRMSLLCNDRPGLLAIVADVLRAQRIRVHDARIATFGERVEDVFLISDQNNCPITDTTFLETLAAGLTSRLEGEF